MPLSRHGLGTYWETNSHAANLHLKKKKKKQVRTEWSNILSRSSQARKQPPPPPQPPPPSLSPPAPSSLFSSSLLGSKHHQTSYMTPLIVWLILTAGIVQGVCVEAAYAVACARGLVAYSR